MYTNEMKDAVDMLSRILYEDKDIIVAYKPAGLAVQTARLGQQDMVSELKNRREKGGNSAAVGRGEPYLGLIHRLDQPVEGILAFARTRGAAASLTGQLRAQGDEGGFCKHYYAVLCGVPDCREGRLEDYLYKQALKNGKHTDYRAVIRIPRQRNPPWGKPRRPGAQSWSTASWSRIRSRDLRWRISVSAQAASTRFGPRWPTRACLFWAT